MYETKFFRKMLRILEFEKFIKHQGNFQRNMFKVEQILFFHFSLSFFAREISNIESITNERETFGYF